MKTPQIRTFRDVNWGCLAVLGLLVAFWYGLLRWVL